MSNGLGKLAKRSDAVIDSIELEMLREFYSHWMQMHKFAKEHPSTAVRHAQSMIGLSKDLEEHYLARGTPVQ